MAILMQITKNKSQITNNTKILNSNILKFGIGFFGLFVIWCLLFGAYSAALAASPAVRIKDIGHVLEARENQLMGFGLVVGLRNSGDRSQTGFTQQALTNLLARMGVVPQSVDFKARNVAAVMVTAKLPPFVRPGQKIDITVSSVGDASSLQGGTLLLTPLEGVDGNTYAVAQGSLLVGSESGRPTVPLVKGRQTTVGLIPGGALVEKAVPVSMGENDLLTIVLDQPDFTTANRVANTISSIGFTATANDAASVSITLVAGTNLVKTISQIENLTVVPDAIAKIIVNERTGTIVIGENVRISPVAVSFSNIDVTIGDVSLFSEGSSADSADDQSRYRARSLAHLTQTEGKLTPVTGGATLSSLVRALNAIGASPKDLIAILQSMKKAGAIQAELEVI